MIKEITNITNWQDLKKDFDSIGEFWVFRGHSDSEWKLRTSVDRFEFPHKFWAEKRMLYDFSKNYKTFKIDEIDFKDDIQKIALLQHHGTPTRFLDVTHSPYIAAFFAFENIPKDVDFCSIYAFHYLALTMKTLQLLREREDIGELDNIENSNALSNPETFEQLVLNENQNNFVGVINPGHIFSRLRNQIGSFLCQGNINVDFEINLNDINSTIYPNPIFRKYVLPKAMRLEVLSDLRKMNISRYTLFQDLDGFAKSLPVECEIQIYREEQYSKKKEK